MIRRKSSCIKFRIMFVWHFSQHSPNSIRSISFVASTTSCQSSFRHPMLVWVGLIWWQIANTFPHTHGPKQTEWASTTCFRYQNINHRSIHHRNGAKCYTVPRTYSLVASQSSARYLLWHQIKSRRVLATLLPFIQHSGIDEMWKRLMRRMKSAFRVPFAHATKTIFSRFSSSSNKKMFHIKDASHPHPLSTLSYECECVEIHLSKAEALNIVLLAFFAFPLVQSLSLARAPWKIKCSMFYELAHGAYVCLASSNRCRGSIKTFLSPSLFII